MSIKKAILKKNCLKSRDDKIRTCGLFVPNEARYRAALHPETISTAKVRKNQIEILYAAKKIYFPFSIGLS